MNLTFSIANSKIKDNKCDFLAEKFDHTLLLSEKKIVILVNTTLLCENCKQ